jgi:hypothetical protein
MTDEHTGAVHWHKETETAANLARAERALKPLVFKSPWIDPLCILKFSGCRECDGFASLLGQPDENPQLM